MAARVTSNIPQKAWLVGALLGLSVLAVYFPALNHDFVSFDDPDYITDNAHVKQGLNLANIRWAFTTGEIGNWHPLTWISHMLDVSLFGLNPRGHHAAGILLHALNAILLFVLWNLLTRRWVLSAFVAVVFALHPLRVESVAWAAERKDVLSGFFFLLGSIAYTHYARQPSLRRYSLVTVIFILGLLSKSMLVTLPAVWLLLDFWPLRRLGTVGESPGPYPPRKLSQLLLEKLPWLSLSLTASVVTVLVQSQVGLVKAVDALPWSYRLANCLGAYLSYLELFFWPHGLAMLYPHLGRAISWERPLLGALVLIGVTVIVLRQTSRRPYLAVGWLWFLGMMVPVIGLVQVGTQSMADRYTYLPQIGLVVMVTWAAAPLFSGRNRLGALLMVLVIGSLTAATRRQLSYWRDTGTALRRALAVTRNNYIVHLNLGDWLLKHGQEETARRHYQRTLQIAPRFSSARIALGGIAYKNGRHEEALAHYRQALQDHPEHNGARLLLGFTLAMTGRFAEGVPYLKESLRREPDASRNYFMTGQAYRSQGLLQEAVHYFQNGLSLAPANADAHCDLGAIYHRQGKLDEAVARYREALRLRPGFARAHSNLGLTLWAQGRANEARAQLETALRLNPNASQARQQLTQLVEAGE